MSHEYHERRNTARFASEFAKQELFRSSAVFTLEITLIFSVDFPWRRMFQNHGQTANPMKYKLSIDDPLILQLIISLRSH